MCAVSPRRRVVSVAYSGSFSIRQSCAAGVVLVTVARSIVRDLRKVGFSTSTVAHLDVATLIPTGRKERTSGMDGVHLCGETRHAATHRSASHAQLLQSNQIESSPAECTLLLCVARSSHEPSHNNIVSAPIRSLAHATGRSLATWSIACERGTTVRNRIESQLLVLISLLLSLYDRYPITP